MANEEELAWLQARYDIEKKDKQGFGERSQGKFYRDPTTRIALNSYLGNEADRPVIHAQADTTLYRDGKFGVDAGYNAFLEPSIEKGSFTPDDIYREKSLGLRYGDAKAKAFLGDIGSFKERGVVGNYNLGDGYVAEAKYSEPVDYDGDKKSLALHKYMNGGRASASVKKKSGKPASAEISYTKKF